MAWMKTGTVTVENGSPVITGNGTSWFGALQAGWGFVGPDGRTYEVLSVQSATQLTLASIYKGATAAGQAYSAFPTQSLAADLTASLQALISNYQTIHDKAGQGRFPGDVVFDADRDTGMGNPSSNEVGLKAGNTWQLRLKGSQASGAAVQANWLDAAVGKLLKPGAFGWGHDASNGAMGTAIGALSELSVNALYRYSSANSDAPSAAGILIHMNRIPDSASGGRMQLAISHAGRLYTRVQDGVDPVTYSPWEALFAGTGVNGNGEFTRFPDGTQICRFTGAAVACETSIGTAFMNDTLQSWVFPAAFVAGADVMLSGSGGASTRNLGIAGASPASAVYRVTSPFSDPSTYPPSLVAIGRWK